MDFRALATRWVGSRALTYDVEKQRYEALKVQHEYRVVAQILGKLGRGLRLLDVPVGTGRFLEFYKEQEQQVTGIDVSSDMLAQAKARSDALCFKGSSFLIGDIRRLPYTDSHFDLVMCAGFLNWVDTQGFANVLAELARVSRQHLIIVVRHYLSLRDLGPLSLAGLQEYGRQLNRRARQALRRNRFTNIHSLRIIKHVFENKGLQMQYCEATERRHIDGTESVVYWLTKLAYRNDGSRNSAAYEGPCP